MLSVVPDCNYRKHRNRISEEIEEHFRHSEARESKEGKARKPTEAHRTTRQSCHNRNEQNGTAKLLPSTTQGQKEKLRKTSALFGSKEIAKERNGKEISEQQKHHEQIVLMTAPAFSEKEQKCSEVLRSTHEQLG